MSGISGMISLDGTKMKVWELSYKRRENSTSSAEISWPKIAAILYLIDLLPSYCILSANVLSYVYPFGVKYGKRSFSRSYTG
jgi:hypothetical protein